MCIIIAPSHVRHAPAPGGVFLNLFLESGVIIGWACISVRMGMMSMLSFATFFYLLVYWYYTCWYEIFQASVPVCLNASADSQFSLLGHKIHVDNISFVCHGPDEWSSLCILIWTRSKSTWGKKGTQMRAHNATLLTKCQHYFLAWVDMNRK